jgi:tetratricopeptide (TPR) repeat protein
MLLVFGSVALGASVENTVAGDAAGWTRKGHERFESCEFKAAAQNFSKALQYQPEDANLYYWLGRSYERMAEVASALHAPRDARRARFSLERAVDLEPRNREYLRELFDFYLDSPEWFKGGLGNAGVLIQRIAPDDPAAQELLRELLAEAKDEYRGAAWRVRQATLVPSAGIGRVIP